MKTQTIEVEGLPKGYKPVAFRIGLKGELAFDCNRVIEITGNRTKFPCLIIEKIQSRRIVLEETDEDDSDISFHDSTGTYTYWRQVKETDIPLNNEEPKLSLSLDKCIELVRYGMMVDLPIQNEIREFVTENNS